MPKTQTKTRKPRATKAKAKPATTPVSAGPSKAEQRGAQMLSERIAAATAVASYYAGSSRPFKAASSTFKPINLANGKNPSVRQAAAIAAMLIHSNGNVKADGTFKRGGFTVPASLADKSAPAGAMLQAQPESGVLGNMLGNAVAHVSGPTAGAAQRDAIYRFDFEAVEKLYLPLLSGTIRQTAFEALREIRG